MISQIGKALRTLSREGVGAFGRIVRERRLRREYVVYRRSLAGSVIEVSGETVVRQGSLEELQAWRSGQEKVAPPFIADITAGWREFFWAWSNGEAVGIAWTTNRSPLIEAGAAEGVIVDLYTVPAARGRGVATRLINAICSAVKERSLKALYATVEEQNVASRRAFERAGFEAIGRFTSQGWFRTPVRTDRWVRAVRSGGV